MSIHIPRCALPDTRTDERGVWGRWGPDFFGAHWRRGTRGHTGTHFWYFFLPCHNGDPMATDVTPHFPNDFLSFSVTRHSCNYVSPRLVSP
jgi:hypothetical protein